MRSQGGGARRSSWRRVLALMTTSTARTGRRMASARGTRGEALPGRRCCVGLGSKRLAAAGSAIESHWDPALGGGGAQPMCMRHVHAACARHALLSPAYLARPPLVSSALARPPLAAT